MAQAARSTRGSHCMSKLKYRACQRVRFTAADTLREGVIDFALSSPADDPFADTLYDIQDDQGHMFYDIPGVQVHGLAVARDIYQRKRGGA